MFFFYVRCLMLDEWSNGVVEGYVNKLKTIKRTLYGRASINLLECKMYLNDHHSFT